MSPGAILAGCAGAVLCTLEHVRLMKASEPQWALEQVGVQVLSPWPRPSCRDASRLVRELPGSGLQGGWLPAL